MRAIFRVLNGGDAESVEAGVMELENAVNFVAREEDENSPVGQLAAQVLAGIQSCLGFETDEDEDGDGGPGEADGAQEGDADDLED